MFWEKWIPHKYLVKPQACGVEVVMSDNGLQIYGTIVKSQGGKISLGTHFSAEQKPALPEEIKKNKIPLVLCVTGKGIINKKILLPAEQEEPGLEEIVTQNIPAVTLDEFYVQLHRQDNGHAFLSVIRKAPLDQILQLFASARADIADVIIGPAFVSGVGPVVSSFNRLQTLTYTIELANNSVDTIIETAATTNEAQNALDLEGLSLQPAQLLGFGAAFIYLTHSFDRYTSGNVLEQHRNRHLEANKLRVLSYFFIVLAFILCLLNFFIFNSYFGQSRKLDTELSLYQGKYEQINELLTNYEKQKGLIEQAGILDASVISELSDKIAGTIPDEVVLTEWVFNPVKERDDTDSLMNFSNNTILIRGNCNKSLIVNEWINVLKSQNFIADINLEKFSFTNEGNQPNFELKIITN